jgi:cytokinesis protein
MSSQRSSSSLGTTVNPTITTPSMASTEFSFPRPKQDQDIEYLFEDLLERTAVPQHKRADAARLHVSKKWAMVYNDKLQEWQQARKKPPLDRTASQGTPALPGSPKPETTPVLQQSANLLAAANLSRSSTETATPEWYLTKFMDGSIQPATVSSLRVALRTYAIAWVETFVVKLQGLSVLTNALANITRLAMPRKENDLRLELEIVKCLKDLLQRSQIGLDAALHYPHCIFSIVLDISSPNVQARKLVMDMLIFLAYQKKDGVTGHNYVLRGLDNLMNIRGDHGRFDAWFTILETTLDGRGKMGSLVGASEEIRTLRGREAQAAMQAANGPESTNDSALTEYCVSRFFQWLDRD